MLLLPFRNALIDDAYITMGYARNLVEGNGWGLVAGIPANSATSPLGVIALATSFAVVPGETGVILLSALECAVSILALARLSRHLFGSFFLPLVAGPVLLLNPIMLSSIGMESHLALALVLWMLVHCTAGRWIAAGIFLGLLCLARPDNILWLPILPMIFGSIANCARAGLAALPVGAPWLMWSMHKFGALVPDTLFIKQQQDWGPWTYHRGFGLLMELHPLETVTALAPLGLTVLMPAVRQYHLWRWVLGMMAFGALHFAVYSLLGVPPYHWYLLPTILSWGLAGSLAAASFVANARRPGVWRGVVLTFVAAYIAVCAVEAARFREGWQVTQSPMHGNWATPKEYRQIGKELASLVREKETVMMEAEIGTLAWTSRRALLDEFSSRRKFMKIAMRGAEGSGLKAAYLRMQVRHAPPAADGDLPTWLLTQGAERSPGPGTVLVREWPITNPKLGYRSSLKLFRLRQTD